MNHEQEIFFLERIHALESEANRKQMEIAQMEIAALVTDIKRQAEESHRLRIAAGELPPEDRKEII